MESIPDQIKLHFLVQWAVRTERRQVVDLDQPWLQLGVDHDIHAEDLEAY